MGFLEKLKNTFFEEEYVEVQEKPEKTKKVEVKEEPVFKKVEIEKIEKKQPLLVDDIEEDIDEEDNILYDEPKDIPKTSEVKFNYFDDEDFLDDSYIDEVKEIDNKKQPPKNIEPEPKPYDNSLYNGKKVINEDKIPYKKESTQTKFKPTPIISPIYGILDKNYTKDDIVDKKEIKPSSSYVSRKNVDLDSIRQKAFGFIDDEIEEKNDSTITDISEETSVSDIEDSYESEKDDGLLYDMTEMDKTPNVDKVTLQDAEEYYEDLGLEYNVDYKDARLERKTGKRVNKEPKLDEIEETNDDKLETIDENFDMDDNIEKYDNSSLEDNLFDLIDSMYDDKEE